MRKWVLFSINNCVYFLIVVSCILSLLRACPFPFSLQCVRTLHKEWSIWLKKDLFTEILLQGTACKSLRLYS